MTSGSPDAPSESPAQLRRRLDLDDDRLRGECVVHTHRTGGPGGQHRNKTESAVRLFHRASGLTVTGEERRSQHQNAANALLRLREAIAVQFRSPLAERCVWPEGVHIRDRKLRVSESNAGFYHALGLALDALAAFRGVPQDAAAWLGVSTSSLARFLADHPKAWREANRIREEHGLPPLKV
ncbi:Peptide chain release factor 1 [Phycisphaerae bacterium RAS1]|nr:Peptide chain release factor 1 [Phycisphaerae bacterium RAS1]